MGWFCPCRSASNAPLSLLLFLLFRQVLVQLFIKVYKRVNISILVLSDASDVMGYMIEGDQSFLMHHSTLNKIPTE